MSTALSAAALPSDAWSSWAGALLLQQAQIHGGMPDTTVVKSPLPGGIAQVVRYLFNLPSWFQIWGFVAGVIVAIVILVILWRRRRAIIAAILALPRAALISLGTLAAAIVVGIIVFAKVSWDYTQHNNDFCVGCHVMTTSYERFQTSEHRKLQCHDCHQQSIYASVRQVYLWVAEKPASIPPHAKVPTRVCARCHIQGQGEKKWQRIIATAGHSVHLRSNNPKLRNIQCVTCHGVELHRFMPVERTCGQAGCHTDIAIKLGKMADQTQLHCVTCHRFTATVAEGLAPDSAARVMSPARRECLDCHQMQRVIRDFDQNVDPHHGQCGWCHNPHTQTTPRAAVASCTNAGCHAQPDTLTPLHRGLTHGVLGNCLDCHAAHSWKVSGAACRRCHTNIASTGSPPDTTFARLVVDAIAPAAAGRRLVPPGPSADPSPELLPEPPPPPRQDTLPPFSHRDHRLVSCTDCHTSARRHGELAIHSVRDCMACHHSPERGANCLTCHRQAQLPEHRTIAALVRTTTHPEGHERSLSFSHSRHTELGCRECHTEPVTMKPRACADCHTDHHRATADCSTCHQPSRSVHDRSVHQGCSGSGCHADEAVLALAPTRNVCLVCHRDRAQHQPGRNCATCHAVDWQISRGGVTRP